MWWILQSLWFVVWPWSDRIQTRGWRHGKNVFIGFLQHAAQFWKCLREYFGLSKWRPRKKFSRRGFTSSREKWSNREKKSSWRPENVLTGRNLDKSCRGVSLLRETCSFKNVFLINLSWTTEDVKNLFEEAVYKLYALIIHSKDTPFSDWLKSSSYLLLLTASVDQIWKRFTMCGKMTRKA